MPIQIVQETFGALYKFENFARIKTFRRFCLNQQNFNIQISRLRECIYFISAFNQIFIDEFSNGINTKCPISINVHVRQIGNLGKSLGMDLRHNSVVCKILKLLMLWQAINLRFLTKILDVRGQNSMFHINSLSNSA
ncbi:hypothetical protein Xant_14260 [Xanthomonas cissicola]|uniref:Transposase n=1 Tax=Xanthomonas cissicola TaxID=86186 RepID=A0ABX3LUX8_9XANT|nr:hypothetical protein Xant_14260 [Xanthomonas cissicola]